MRPPTSDPPDYREPMLALVKQMYELTDVVRLISTGSQATLRHPRLDQIKAELRDIGQQLGSSPDDADDADADAGDDH